MNTITSEINLSDPAPHKEPERQYYFIEKAKEYVRKEAEEAGRPMTCVYNLWVSDECGARSKNYAEFYLK